MMRQLSINQQLVQFRLLGLLSSFLIINWACQDPPTDPTDLNPNGTAPIGNSMNGGGSTLPQAGEELPMAGDSQPLAGTEQPPVPPMTGMTGGTTTPIDMPLGDMMVVEPINDMYVEVLVDMEVEQLVDMEVEIPLEPDMMAPPPIELPDSCDGPLELPIPNCRPAPLPSTGDLYEDCVRRVNQLRAECQCLPPLERWTEGEDCADQHAEYDAMTNQPHNGFREGICQPGGRGQNECPGYQSENQVISLCLQQMWDEGPGEPFSAHGHYINMTNPSHQRVACGFYTTEQGRVWAIQNYSP